MLSTKFNLAFAENKNFCKRMLPPKEPNLHTVEKKAKRFNLQYKGVVPKIGFKLSLLPVLSRAGYIHV